MAESAISSVLSMLGNLAITETKFLKGVPDQVESIKSELRSMQGFLKDAELKQRRGDNSATILVQEIRDVAYEAENVVAKINWMQIQNNKKKGCLGTLSRYKNVFSTDLITLRETGKKIENIQKKIDAIFQRKDKYDSTKLETSVEKDENDLFMEDDLNMQRLLSPYFESKHDVIGFQNEIEKIVEELTDPLNKDLRFVSLVGMGGIGKSTLASKVFTDPKIENSFSTLVWISVSRSYKPIELLKDIMKKIMNIKKEQSTNKNEITEQELENMSLQKVRNEITEQELENMSLQKVREKLYEFLKNKKYLIVLDDVWTPQALDQITFRSAVFPNLNNGSRIIITTRNKQVANHTSYINHIHELKPLDENESWELLRKKAFYFPNKINETTLKELENLGMKLSKECNGLPLALSVLGGFLSKNVDPDVWSKMVNNLDWEETNNEKNIVEILALSFYDLPNHLKSCFLYMACFPEDHLISTSKLIKMWIAEGFIPFKNKYSQEETGRKFLVELAQRSMVQAVEISKTHGWIKRIRVHDILRDFCIEESAKVGFFKICNNLGNFEASRSDGVIAYRIAFNKFYSNEVRVSMPNLRTIIGFDLAHEPSLCGLNFVRVLELVGVSNIEKIPDEIGRMVFLRYIGLRKCGGVNVIQIPSSIGYLINLQTFDARGTRIKSMPDSFWKILTLRQVYLNVEKFNKWKLSNQDELQNVHTLRIRTYYGISNERAFIGTLKEKSGIFSLSLDGLLFPLEYITGLSSHPGLQELSLCGRPFNPTRNKSLPNNTLFPPNIRKLKLEWIYLSEDPMPILELLPSLVVLLLDYGTYVGKKMACSADGFRQLQYIQIEYLFNLKEWKIEAGSMPKLSKLNLNQCSELKMQPEELMHLPALKELKLNRMLAFPKETCSKLEEIGCKVIRND